MPENIKLEIKKIIELIISPLTKINKIEFVCENSQYRIILDLENKDVFLKNNCELLLCIQHIVRVMLHSKFPDDRTHFFFDVGNYNKNREHILGNQVPILAHDKVLAEGKSIILVNLSGYERLLVHNILLDVNGVETTSVGEGKNRKLLIIPTSDLGMLGLENSIIFDLNLIQE